MKKTLLGVILSICLLSGQQVSALLISPGTHLNSGDETAQSVIEGIVKDIIREDLNLEITDPVYQLYKADVDTGSEYGSYADWYQTTFSNTASDPADADIEWSGIPESDDPFILPSMYLLVKDGN